MQKMRMFQHRWVQFPYIARSSDVLYHYVSRSGSTNEMIVGKRHLTRGWLSLGGSEIILADLCTLDVQDCLDVSSLVFDISITGSFIGSSLSSLHRDEESFP